MTCYGSSTIHQYHLTNAIKSDLAHCTAAEFFSSLSAIKCYAAAPGIAINQAVPPIPRPPPPDTGHKIDLWNIDCDIAQTPPDGTCNNPPVHIPSLYMQLALSLGCSWPPLLFNCPHKDTSATRCAMSLNYCHYFYYSLWAHSIEN